MMCRAKNFGLIAQEACLWNCTIAIVLDCGVSII